MHGIVYGMKLTKAEREILNQALDDYNIITRSAFYDDCRTARERKNNKAILNRLKTLNKLVKKLHNDLYDKS